MLFPALDRLQRVRRLFAREQYFVVHAPRQTAKTTLMTSADSAPPYF
jgi:hypothetical protein